MIATVAPPAPAQIAAPPYFDPRALRVELTALAARHRGAPERARPELIERLKRLKQEARLAARAQLEFDGNGRACAEGLSGFQDALIHLVFDYTIAHVYQASNPSERTSMAIVATGGYGRGLLAPGSDIDLLFLVPNKQTAWGESVVEYMLYVLWDLQFKVGHATRTVDQCLKYAHSDLTIRTSLLDVRLIFGNARLYTLLVERFQRSVVAGTAKAFIEAKMAERDERHRRSGESRYKVEPNIKDGKGGLRDLHTLHWIAKYVHGEGPGAAAGAPEVFSVAERAMFRRCEDFLWTIRCLLHFVAGRPEERLTFEWQPPLAERLRYRDRGGLRGVERFMKHYFLVAKDVGDLTTILVAALEMQQLKSSPGLTRLLNPMTWRARRRVRRVTDFRIDNGRLNVADRDVFRRDPVNLIRFFAEADRNGAFIHPEALRLLRASFGLIDDKLRVDPEANRIFLELLCARENPEATLRRMNEAGVLGRFIPEFGRIVSMMQFNMYHHFTVDEHLIRTVGQLNEIEHGAVAEALPVSTAIIGTIQNRRALYVAAFIHDIAKGRGEDHSIAGARFARRLCPRFGLDKAETETVAWLVEHHLTMSTVAQSRDLGDPKTIRAFADIVQSPERLKLLLLLTVVDIRAVGPGTWNGWKGQLLRTLYAETEPLVAGGHTQEGFRDRVAAAERAFRTAMGATDPAATDAFVARQYPYYWLKTETRKQVEHAQLMARAENDGLKLATDCATDAFRAVTELSIMAPNHARLLALFAGACAASGANIVGAHVSTTRDGYALDTFLLQREFESEDDERRRAARIGETITKVLKGEARLSELMAKRRGAKGSNVAFRVAPEVVIDNGASDQFTVIEVAGLDRPGLLYDLTSTLSDLSLDITSAHITTFGEKAVDVFYVTDLTNKKIDGQSRQRAIRERLLGALQPETAAEKPAAAKPAPARK